MISEQHAELLTKYSAYLARLLEENNIPFERNFERWSRPYQSGNLTPLAPDVKPRTAQEELDSLGEQLAANHAKLQKALRW